MLMYVVIVIIAIIIITLKSCILIIILFDTSATSQGSAHGTNHVDTVATLFPLLLVLCK